MYVCLCKGVTDKQIRQAVNNGAESMRHLSQCLGVASQCGKCGKHAKEILRESRAGAVNNGLIFLQAIG